MALENMGRESVCGDQGLVVYVDADLEELIPGFFANQRRDLQAMTESLAAGDLDSVRALAHRLKGSGGGYGCDELTRLGAAIEAAARREDAAAAATLLQQLDSYLRSVRVVFEDTAG